MTRHHSEIEPDRVGMRVPRRSQHILGHRLRLRRPGIQRRDLCPVRGPHSVLDHRRLDSDPAAAELVADRLGDANDLTDARLARRLERDAHPIGDLVPEHGLVDEPGGSGVVSEVG